MLTTSAWAGIGKGHHVNIISFQKDHEFSGELQYPDDMRGDFSDLIEQMEGKAEPFLIVHTPHIHPKDAVNAQVDALGERGNGSLEDDGLNCEFLFDKKNEEFTLGGVCTVIMAGVRENTEHKFIIKPQTIPAIQKNEKPTWKRLFVDSYSGTAFYVSIER